MSRRHSRWLWLGLLLALAVQAQEAGPAPADSDLWVGIMITDAVDGGGRLAGVIPSGPAERAGVAPGDEAVSINDLKLSAANIDKRLSECHMGDEVSLRVFRCDELMSFKVIVEQSPENTCYLVVDESAKDTATENRESWLLQK